ncbi:MAG: STAS/SEC14 domain-containing protein [Chloroflexi bacterium]|nr:STAS/SEC14 domain-containing protein [Chloroflexota bacterium]
MCWDNAEKTTLLFEFQGQWTLNELYACMNKAQALMAEVTHPLDFVVDLRQSRTLPPGFIPAMRYVYDVSHQRMNRMALVGMNRFIMLFNDMFMQLNPNKPAPGRVLLCATPEEARAWLRETQAQPT